MFEEHIKDYRLQKKLSQAIIKKGGKTAFALRGMSHCGHRSGAPEAGVGILSNGRGSFINGVHWCGNSWICPVCSAIKMYHYGAKIAAALEALKKDYNAVMITYTVFHTKHDTAAQVFDLLFETWKKFVAQRCSSNKIKKNGEKYKSGVLANFFNELGIKYTVRCSEVTYTENGWHPHHHVLYWVPKKNFDKVLDFEEKLRERWRKCQISAMKKVFGYEKYVGLKESDKKDKINGVFISKNNDKPAIAQSSDYICGWGGDKELTGNSRKTARGENSMTIFEMIDAANANNDYMEKVIEAAEYLRSCSRRRCNLSKGLTEIIVTQMNTEGYKEVLKKKRADVWGKSPWRLVIWFSSSDWSSLCYKDMEIEESVITKILIMACEEDGYEQILKYLKELNLDLKPRNYDPVGIHKALADALNQSIDIGIAA